MRALIGAPGFPYLLDWGKGQNAREIFGSAEQDSFDFLIQSKLGESFKDTVDNYGLRSLEEVKKIGI